MKISPPVMSSAGTLVVGLVTPRQYASPACRVTPWTAVDAHPAAGMDGPRTSKMSASSASIPSVTANPATSTHPILSPVPPALRVTTSPREAASHVTVQSATVESVARPQPVPNVSAAMFYSTVDAYSITAQPRTVSSVRPIAPPSVPPAPLASKSISIPIARSAANRVRP